MNRLSTLLSESANKFPDKTALIIEQQSYTYYELHNLAHRLAVSLSGQGVKQGDSIAFLLPNSLEIILCYYACFMLGAIAVPVNIQFNPEMIEYVLQQSNANIFITTPVFYKQLVTHEKTIAAIKECYLTENYSHYEGTKDLQKLISFSTKSSVIHTDFSVEKPALIFFTSGTTGLPKAVVHSHHSLWAGTQNQITQININNHDNTLVMFPVCYLIGLGSQILPFHAAGATVVLLPSFHPEEALAKLHSYGITKIYGFSKLYLELINCAESIGYQTNTLNFCFSGGDAMSVVLQKRFKSLFHTEITEGCGMSELQIYSMNPLNGEKKMGSIGLPIVGMEMLLIDEQDKVILQTQQIGEIIVHGEGMCAGYWQNADLTAKTIKNGWLHTSDLAYRDEDGYYWFVSRKVDIIRCGDVLISPREIEEIFCRHQEVKEAAAIALPNSSKANDDKIIVYIVLNNPISSSSLMDFACSFLPINKRPDRIIIIKKLPYGFTGKIDRQALRNRAKKI